MSDSSPEVGDGTSAGLGLRVGTAIGERWGLDVEAVYPGRITWEYNDPFQQPTPATGLTIVPGRYSYALRVSTLSTAVWVRQRPHDRLDLIYLGGIVFVRGDGRSGYDLPNPVPPTPPLSYTREFTSYYAGPLLGLDAPVRLTDRLAAVPAVRLMIFDDLLVARPSIGIRFQFGR